jgi:peptidoglycan/LPS O-acetylase OafA/YrhL
VARFARLYPLYMFFLLAYVSIHPLDARGYYTITATTYLTLTQSWFPYTFANGVTLSRIYLANAWSISTEVALYLAFIPGSALFLRVKSPIYVKFAIAFWVLACSAITLVAWRMSLTRPTFGWSGWLTYTSPFWRLMEFGLGAFLAKLLSVDFKPVVQAKRRENLLAVFGTLLCTLPWFAQAFLPGGGIMITWGAAPGVAILIFHLCRYQSPLRKFMSSRPLVICGEASYSLYFFHGWLIAVFQGSVPNGPLLAFKLVEIWIMCVVISIGLYTVLEKPARQVLRQKLSLSREKVLGPAGAMAKFRLDSTG